MRIRIAVALLVLGAATASQASQDIYVLGLPVNHIAFSTVTGKLYATVPSRAGMPYGNHVVEIGVDGTGILREAFVGSEPDPIGISPDSAIAYIGLSGVATVRRVDLGTMSGGIWFDIGTGFENLPLYAVDIETMPGSPETIAIARRNVGYPLAKEGVAIYDSGVMRPVTTNPALDTNHIAFGTQPDLLYGYYNATTAGGLRRMEVDASGVEVVQDSTPFAGAFRGTIIVSGGRIYHTRGESMDTTNLAVLGTYGSTGPVVVDEPLATVFFANTDLGTDTTTLRTFDRDTFIPLGIDVELPSGGGIALKAVRCGSECVAILQEHDRIVIASNYFTPLHTDSFE